MRRNNRNQQDVEMTAQSFCNLSQRLKFAEEFVQVANEGEKAKEVFSFFCYFVAFNMLYRFNTDEHEHENLSIKNFLATTYQRGDFEFHPGDNPEFPLLNGKVVKGDLDGTQDGISEKPYIEHEDNHDICVFLRIYQIRCNLFHGAKQLEDWRDMLLIREANEVFRRFYAEYFKTNNSRNG